MGCCQAAQPTAGQDECTMMHLAQPWSAICRALHPKELRASRLRYFFVCAWQGPMDLRKAVH
jgi:hypothetical protein